MNAFDLAWMLAYPVLRQRSRAVFDQWFPDYGTDPCDTERAEAQFAALPDCWKVPDFGSDEHGGHMWGLFPDEHGVMRLESFFSAYQYNSTMYYRQTERRWRGAELAEADPVDYWLGVP